METTSLALVDYKVFTLGDDEVYAIEGGAFIVPFLAIGAVAAAGVAIYEAGKYTGEFIYKVTH